MPNKKLQLEILEKMSGLATAGFGLVAALAWNEAIQDLFKYFGAGESVATKFGYAALVTILVVVITYLISKSVDHAKKELKIDQHEEQNTKDAK